MRRSRSCIDGIPVHEADIQDSGRVRVETPVREWPIIEGLQLGDGELTKGAVLSGVGLVRARIANLLFPALRLDTVNAVEIHIHGLGQGMEFSPRGDSKDGCSSFYISQEAKQISADIARSKLKRAVGSNE